MNERSTANDARPASKIEMRYVAKRCGRRWGVYDVAVGSFPINTPRTGNVGEGLTEVQANTEADRLNRGEN